MISKELTDEWVEMFSNPEFQNGLMWVLAGSNLLPEGVDSTDERVIKLCELAKTYYQARKKNKK